MNTQQKEKLTKQRRTGVILAITVLVVAVLVGIGMFVFPGLGKGAQASLPVLGPTPPPSSSPTPTATPEQCEDTWPITKADHTNNRWFYEGIASIRDATTNEEAVAAAHDWQDKIRSVPYLQAAAAKVILQRDVDPASLTGDDGCVTQEAVDLDLEIGTALATSHIVAAEAPETGVNTGVENFTVVSDSTPGVSGDRKAIQITTADGRTIWVMARCGNIVTDTPTHPPGTTDNPPKPDCPPNMDGEWPICKDKPTQDPGPRGNAPDGSGPNVDPGPGVFVPEEEMEQPPSTPRVNPPPPAPEPPAPQPSTPSNPTPRPVPTRDPAPAPDPEPSAPAPNNPIGPSDPGAGCLPPPGMTTC